MRTFENPRPEICRSFGDAVAFLDGGSVAIGAPYCEGYGIDGNVFVFDEASGELRLTLENPTPGQLDLFGSTLASLGGDILWDDEDGEQAGRIYLFDGEDGELLLTLAAPHPKPLSFFGDPVAGLDDHHFLAGAPAHNRVYVFDREGVLVRTLEGPHSGIQGPLFGLGKFGAGIAVAGDRLVVLAPQEHADLAHKWVADSDSRTVEADAFSQWSDGAVYGYDLSVVRGSETP